ncbi:MAG: hypothetical protein ACK2UO_11260, partial [Caldilineaceae bacterium]
MTEQDPSTTPSDTPNMIGAYGPWAASLLPQGPGSFSLRRADAPALELWRSGARDRLKARLAQPDTGVA